MVEPAVDADVVLSLAALLLLHRPVVAGLGEAEVMVRDLLLLLPRRVEVVRRGAAGVVQGSWRGGRRRHQMGAQTLLQQPL